MNVDRLHALILAPIVSEKSNRIGAKHNQAVFKVLPSATKAEVKEAVETLFKTKVLAVQTLNVKGKNKRFGQTMGRRSDWKKAYVTLEAGKELDFTGAA
jgi:large subunit ribosomal protein L23